MAVSFNAKTKAVLYRQVISGTDKYSGMGARVTGMVEDVVDDLVVLGDAMSDTAPLATVAVKKYAAIGHVSDVVIHYAVVF